MDYVLEWKLVRMSKHVDCDHPELGVDCCFCHSVELTVRVSEPYFKSCECQFRDDVRVVDLAGAGLMLVAK